jgi:hypothetical protein
MEESRKHTPAHIDTCNGDNTVTVERRWIRETKGEGDVQVVANAGQEFMGANKTA